MKRVTCKLMAWLMILTLCLQMTVVLAEDVAVPATEQNTTGDIALVTPQEQESSEAGGDDVALPVTEAPVTEAPVTEVPVTEAPVTEVPVTEAPVTEAPVTEVPVTEAPVTEAPVTEAPVTEAPVTEAPTVAPPTVEPSATPSLSPSTTPSATPSATPTATVSVEPTVSLEPSPSPEASIEPLELVMYADLPINESIFQYNLGAGNVFYHKVVLPASGYVSATVSTVMQSVKVSLFDEQMVNCYQTSTGGGTGVVPSSVMVGAWLDAGIYYVMVSYDGYTGNYSIKAKFTYANNVIAGARSMLNAYNFTMDGQTRTGVITKTDSCDYLRLDVTKPGKLAFTLDCASNGITATLFGVENVEKANLTATVSGGTASFQDWFEAGTYFLRIETGNDAYGVYSLKGAFASALNTEKEPNNGYATAQEVSFDAPTITGLLSQTDKVDIYRFITKSVSSVTFTLNANMNDLSVELWNYELTSRYYDCTRYNTGGSELTPAEHSMTVKLQPGVYNLKVYNPNGNGRYTLKTSSRLLLLACTPNATSISLGNSITFTTSAAGSSAVRSYSYSVFNDLDVLQYQTVSSSNVFTYKPNKVGSYYVLVEATDGKTSSTVYSDKVGVLSVPKLTMSSVAVSQANVSVGEQTVVTANVIGGSAIAATRFIIYKNVGHTNWSIVNDVTVSKNNTINFTPTTIGEYYVHAIVTDITGATCAGDSVSHIYATQYTDVSIEKVTESATSVRVGEPVTFTIELSGRGDPQFIRYYIFNQNGAQVEVQDTNNKTYTFTPSAAGSYVLGVSVYNGVSWVQANSQWINVSDFGSTLELTDVAASTTAITLGNVVRFTARTSGKGSLVLMDYKIYDSKNTLQDHYYAPINYYEYKPTATGTYHAVVQLYDGSKWGTVKQSVEIVVKAPASKDLQVSSITLTPSTTAAGSPVTCEIQTTGGNSPTLLRTNYYIYNASGTIAAYWSGVAMQHTFKLGAGGRYNAYVEVFDGLSWTSAASSWITVNSVAIKAVTPSATTVKKGAPVTFTVATTDNSKVKQIVYYVKDANFNNIASSSGTALNYTYTPTNPGKFAVHVNVFDGVSWVDQMSAWIQVN